jgi:hypothetical protein
MKDILQGFESHDVGGTSNKATACQAAFPENSDIKLTIATTSNQPETHPALAGNYLRSYLTITVERDHRAR